jgi:hypothetical protein
MQLSHRLQLFSLELPVLRHVEGIEILLTSSDPEEMERNRVVDRGHGNDGKIIQDGRVAVPEGDPRKALMRVLVFEGMRKKRIGHPGNIRIIDGTGESIIE